MSVTYETWCSKCGVRAPEVGDFGYVGSPSLASRNVDDELVPFGVIFDGFAALRMVTAELAAFRAFLAAHTGHPIQRVPDCGREPIGHGEDLDGEEAPQPDVGPLEPFQFAAQGFVEGLHELACDRCQETHRASASAHLQPFAEQELRRNDVDLFLSNVGASSDDNYYRVGGFPFDDIPAAVDFLKAHRTHVLRVRIDPAEHLAAPPTASPQDARNRWEPPEWAPQAHEGYLGPLPPELLPTLAALWHHDPDRRAQACVDLARSRETGTLGYLTYGLTDPAEQVRRQAARAIGALRDARGVRPLGRALLDESEQVVAAAREALEDWGPTAEEALRQARELRGPYSPLRGDKIAATPEAIEQALRDPRWLIRRLAAETLLENRGEPWAFDLLLLLAVSPEGLGRRDAAEALQICDDPRASDALVRLLADRDASTVKRAAQALSPRRLREAVEPLVDALRRGDSLVPRAAAETLIECHDPRAVEPLVGALASPAASAREAAAMVLGAYADPRAAVPLARLLHDDKHAVREAAARALGKIGGAQSVAALAEQLESDDDDDRLYAVWGLAAIPGESARVALIGALGDATSAVRAVAASALAPLDDPRANRAMLAAARRRDCAVAGAAWQLLIAEGDPSTEDALAGAIHDGCSFEMIHAYFDCGNARLAKAAERALGRRWPPSRDERLIRWGSQRGQR